MAESLLGDREYLAQVLRVACCKRKINMLGARVDALRGSHMFNRRRFSLLQHLIRTIERVSRFRVDSYVELKGPPTASEK